MILGRMYGRQGLFGSMGNASDKAFRPSLLLMASSVLHRHYEILHLQDRNSLLTVWTQMSELDLVVRERIILLVQSPVFHRESR